MPLITVTVQHQLDQKSRDLIVQQVSAILASQHASHLQKVLALMSALDDRISAIQAGLGGVNTSISAVGAEIATLKATPAEPTAEQLAALDSLSSGLAAAKASLDGLVQQPEAEPAAELDPNQPQG